MKSASPHILTINGGSSSIKFALFEAGETLLRIVQGEIERIGLPEASLRVQGLNPADNFSRSVPATNHTAAVEILNVRAAEAVALFCYQIKKWIGSFSAALGGLDTLVFSGGIGENAPVIRGRICEGLEFLGIEIDEECNTRNTGVISASSSRVAVRVIHTDEELMIAKSVCNTLWVSTDKGIYF